MAGAGPTEGDVRGISEARKEPEWLLRSRLRSLRTFKELGLPGWVRTRKVDLGSLDFGDGARDLPEVSGEHRVGGSGYDGAARDFASVSGAVLEEVDRLGVSFLSMEEAVRTRGEAVKGHLGTVVPPEDSPFGALNGAVWTGGTYVHVPPGVSVRVPLQAEIRGDAEGTAPFPRTLVVAEAGARVEFIEGCTAPRYTPAPLHASVVEVVALPGSSVRYTGFQLRSKNVHAVVSRHADVHQGASVEWLEADLGAALCVSSPGARLLAPGARAEVLAVALAGAGQHQDLAGRVVHDARGTTSVVTGRAVVRNGGRATGRDTVIVAEGATGAQATLRWDGLMLDDRSHCDARPAIEVDEAAAEVRHEARVERVKEEDLFYVTSRGIPRGDAVKLVVGGALDPFVRRLPTEYAVEFRRLVDLELDDAVG